MSWQIWLPFLFNINRFFLLTFPWVWSTEIDFAISQPESKETCAYVTDILLFFLRFIFDKLKLPVKCLRIISSRLALLLSKMTKSLDKKLLNVLKQWNNENVDVSIFENVLNSTKNFLNWDIDVLWVVLWLRETLYQARGGKFHWKIQLLPFCLNNSISLLQIWRFSKNLLSENHKFYLDKNFLGSLMHFNESKKFQ